MKKRFILILTFCFFVLGEDGICQYFGKTPTSRQAVFIDQDGKVHVWGYNKNNFSLGTGDTTGMIRTPRVIDSSHRWLHASITELSGTLIDRDSNLYFTGRYHLPSIFEGDTLLSPTLYTNPSGVTGWKSTSLYKGDSHIILSSDGKAYYWDGTDVIDPQLVEFPTDVKRWNKVAAGNGYYLLLGDNERLYGFGRNRNGQLGNLSQKDTAKPTMVHNPIGVDKWKTMAAGGDAGISVAIDEAGSLYHWGKVIGQTQGVDSGIYEPVKYSSNEIWKDVVINSDEQILAITTDGKIYVWGGSFAVMTGLNDGRTHLREPTFLPFPKGVFSWSDISISLNACYALDQNCNVWGWGYNSNNYTIGLPSDSGKEFSTPHLIKSFCQQNNAPSYRSKENFTDVHVYPNPVSKNLTAEFTLISSEIIDIELFDILGRKIQTFSHSRYEAGKCAITLNVPDLATGKYILRIQAGKRTASTSIIIE